MNQLRHPLRQSCAFHQSRKQNRENMYTGTVKCYSSSLVWARSRARTNLAPGLALSCSITYRGLVLGQGLCPCQRTSWGKALGHGPGYLGYKNWHEIREVRTQEVWRRHPGRCQGVSPLRLKKYLTGGPGRSSSPSASGAKDTVRST